MSMFDKLHVRWTARLIDPHKNAAVGEGSGFSPVEAMARLRSDLAWKADSDRKKVSRLEEALEVARNADLDTDPSSSISSSH